MASKNSAIKKKNICSSLTRTDKWYLGGGGRLLWAPPFPVWLEYPGFWDKAHYYNREIEPLFTWTILSEGGKEIPVRCVKRTWDPSKLVSRFEICDAEAKTKFQISIEEVKCCLPNDMVTSTITIANTSSSGVTLHLVVWTIQQSYPSKKTTWIENVTYNNKSIQFTKYLPPHHGNAPILPINCTLGINRNINSYSINLSEGSALQPHWKLTPFVEKFSHGKLRNEIKRSGVTNDGLMYMALHTVVEMKAKSEEQLHTYFTASPVNNKREAISHLLKESSSITASEKHWSKYFSSVPYFECSDEFLTRYYWYRWFGLRLNTIDVKEGNYSHPFVCEGIGYFRAPISYSAMCHILENRWQKTPILAQGSLLTFLENARNDGGLRGYIDMDFYRQEMFYHANWGNSLLELYRVHPDKKYLSDVYDGLVKYVEYFDRERDSEKSGLYDIDNHYETGQEYMHRYLAVDPHADMDNWGEVFRLKGVDVTVYLYELKRGLAFIAEMVDKKKDRERWRQEAEVIKKAILSDMWDPKQQMFFDVNPKTGKRTGVKAAVCFYPYMTDIVSKKHLRGLYLHLLNPKEFWTPYPVPSSSADDPFFSAQPEWKGKRMNCPWNGRVWPMTNSHIAEALAQSAIRFNDMTLRKKTVEFITKYIRMMFYEQDKNCPNCFEHYNPFTGEPSAYRGIDDYQHSWVVDLILKYVVGLRPMVRGLVIDPFPFSLEHVSLDNAIVKGKRISVKRTGERFTVFLSGKNIGESTIGQPIVIQEV